MPSPDAEFAAHCVELLAGFGPARARRMFGGHGLYLDGLFVALIADGTLYLKADAQARAAFEAAGCRPFEYAAHDGRRSVMGYWSAPPEATESPALLQPWLRLALDSALRTAAGRRASTRAPQEIPVSPTMPAPRRRKAR
jgi:DNA transformation protein